MNTLKKLTSVTLISIALGLTACGGKDTSSISSDNTTHPEFSWAKVNVSNAYKPTGDIKDTTPTFSWKATKDATNYQFGHEDVDSAMRWKDYTVTAKEAGCQTGNVCSYTPNDVTFAVGDQKVWWVRAKTTKGWQTWSAPYVFKITDGKNPLVSAKPLSPKGAIKETFPKFTWTPSGNGATHYQLGMEAPNATGWHATTISNADANCQSSKCSYSPTVFYKGAIRTWWLREKVNNVWTKWSEGLTFSIQKDQLGPIISLSDEQKKRALDYFGFIVRSDDKARIYNDGPIKIGEGSGIISEGDKIELYSKNRIDGKITVMGTLSEGDALTIRFGKPLKLTNKQQKHALKVFFPFLGGAAIRVIDKDGDGKVSVGDEAFTYTPKRITLGNIISTKLSKTDIKAFYIDKYHAKPKLVSPSVTISPSTGVIGLSPRWYCEISPAKPAYEIIATNINTGKKVSLRESHRSLGVSRDASGICSVAITGKYPGRMGPGRELLTIKLGEKVGWKIRTVDNDNFTAKMHKEPSNWNYDSHIEW